MGKDKNPEIDWSKPEAALKLLEDEQLIPPAEIVELGDPLDYIDPSEEITCKVCMETRRNLLKCCKHHPDTQDVDPETGLCPNMEIESGRCRVYKTPEYPPDCENYFCENHKDE